MAVHRDDVIAGGLMRLFADIAALQAKLAAQAAGDGRHYEREMQALARAADLTEARLRALGRPPCGPDRLARMASIKPDGSGAEGAELAEDLGTALQAVDTLAVILPLGEDAQTAFVLEAVAECHRQALARLRAR